MATSPRFYGENKKKTDRITDLLGNKQNKTVHIRKLYGNVDGKTKIIGYFPICIKPTIYLMVDDIYKTHARLTYYIGNSQAFTGDVTLDGTLTLYKASDPDTPIQTLKKTFTGPDAQNIFIDELIDLEGATEYIVKFEGTVTNNGETNPVANHTEFTTPVPPSGLDIEITGTTKDTISGTATLEDWGIPKDDPTGYYRVEVYPSPATDPHDFYYHVLGTPKDLVLDKANEFTVTNDDEYEDTDAENFEITSNTTYVVRAYANNGRADNFVETTATTAPEASFSVYQSQEIVPSDGTVKAVVKITQPTFGGDASDLTPEYRYSTDGGDTWSDWAPLTPELKDQNITLPGLPLDTDVIIETRTKGASYSDVRSMQFHTSAAPNIIESLTWTYDELRRNTITWHLKIKDGWTLPKTAVLNLKNHNVTLTFNSDKITATATESLPKVYKPNEELKWTVTLTAEAGFTQELSGDIVLARPILGLVIGPDGTKRYITDMVKAGGADHTDDFQYDARYDRFLVK